MYSAGAIPSLDDAENIVMHKTIIESSKIAVTIIVAILRREVRSSV